MHVKKMKEKHNMKLLGGESPQLPLIRHNQVYYTIKLKHFKDYCTDHEIVQYKSEFEKHSNYPHYQALKKIFNELLQDVIKQYHNSNNGQEYEQKQTQEQHTNSTLSRLDFYNSFVCNAINSIDVAKKIRSKSNLEAIIGDNNDDNKTLDNVRNTLNTHSTNIKNVANSCKIVIKENDFGGKNCLMYLIIDRSNQNVEKEYTENDKKLREILKDSNPFCYLRECSIGDYVFYNSIQLFIQENKNNTYILVADVPQVVDQNHGDNEIREAEAAINQQNQEEQEVGYQAEPPAEPPTEHQDEHQDELQDGHQEELQEEKKEGGKGPNEQPWRPQQRPRGPQQRPRGPQQRPQQKSQQRPQQKSQQRPQGQQGKKQKQPVRKQINVNNNIIFGEKPRNIPEANEIKNAKDVFKRCIGDTIENLLKITKNIHINLNDDLRNVLTISLRYLNTNQH